MQGTKDNSNLVQDDINSVDHLGGRVAARWFVDDEWSVTGMAMYQRTEADGRNDFDPTVGDLQTVKFFEDFRDDEWYQVSLTLEGSFGNGFSLVSNTSYFERDIDYQFDRTTYSAYFNYNFCSYYATYCWSGTTVANQDTVGFNTLVQENDRFTQEIRLSQDTENYRWVLGAFYEEKSEYWEYRAVTPEFLSTLSYAYWTYFYAPSNVDPSWWLSVDDTEWSQWAVFGNFSYNFSDAWELEVGLRYFDQDVDRTYFVDKPFIVAPGVWPDVTNPLGGNQDTVPKVALTYKLSDNKMVYALFSEGFRAGGANRNRTPNTVFPQAYDPDKLSNYEVGLKSRWLDQRLQVNATFFFMEWEDYQIEVVDPSFRPCEVGEVPDVDLCGQPFQVMVANVGDAEQTGLELDIQGVIGDGLNVGVNMLFLDAETAEDFVVTEPVPAGTSLPNVPELKYTAHLQQTWPVNFVSNGTMYARLQYTYQDESRNQLEDFPIVPPRTPPATPTRIQPSYGIADLKVGLQGVNWELQGFVNNFTDERAVLFENHFFFDSFWGNRRVITNRPREYGVRFTYRWE